MIKPMRYECFECERVFHNLVARCIYCGSESVKPMPSTGGTGRGPVAQDPRDLADALRWAGEARLYEQDA